MPSPDLKAKLDALTPEQREQLKRVLAARKTAAQTEKAEQRKPEGLKEGRAPEPDGKGGTPLQALQRVPDADDYPLSFAQKRLWLQEQLIEGRTAAYNVSLAVILRGPLDIDALERAFRIVIERHAVLRTVYVRNADGEPRQRILASPDWHLERWSSVVGRELARASASETRGELPANPGSLRANQASAAREAFITCAAALANRLFALDRELPLRAACMPLGDSVHGLALVLHHIACDGSSVPLLLEHLRRFYAAESGEATSAESGDPALECEPVRYIDYAVWHRDWIASPAAAKSRDWWLKQFAELPVPIELPSDRPRPTVQDFTGRHLHLHFDSATVGRLTEVGQRSGASLFMTLHAAVVAFLHRYAGCEDITIGVPTEGRFHPQLQRIVGFFVNTLALRSRVTPHEPFTALLERVRDGVLDAFEHQDFPFDALVDALRLDRDLSRPPLFNVMMGLNRAADEAVRLTGVADEAVPLPLEASKVDLTFHFVESAAGLDLDLEFASALFSEKRIARMASYFAHVLEAVTVAPRGVIGDLPLMPPAQLRALVDGFNPPGAAFPRERSLVELFQEQVRRAPDANAVYFGGRQFSYAEIDRLSDAIAAHLVATLGPLRRDEPVALQVDRSERMIAALLGILKAGGCYLPINPGTPSERVLMLLEGGRVRLRLVDDEPPVPGWKGRDAMLRSWCDEDAERLKEFRAAGAVTAGSGSSGSSLAYIIFTSGSTGQPKGVLIEQRSVVRLVRNTDFLQLGPADRVLQTGSLAFDASTFELWAPLLNGGCCCLPRGREVLEVSEFGALLQATGATTCFLTTGLFNQIADFNPQAFAHLRNLLTGGEKVSVPHMNRVLAAAPGIRLLHVYGPTENTTFSTWYPVSDAAVHDVPIGRAIAHSTVYVLDPRGNLLPPGVVGELFCGGEGIARGYLGGPELTADRFVPDPFSTGTGARLYRTGDLGRWNDEGNIEFVGRNDDQVKIRGFRIELGEIELRLRAIPGVQQAVVVARPSGGTHELVAYVVQPGGSAEALRGVLRSTLPDYMAPTHVVFLKRLPLNASGKVNRRALPAPERTEEAAPGHVTEWTTAAEKALALVWTNVLGRPPHDRESHYFNLGGDSIKAIQMAARLRSHGFKLTLRDVFAHPRFGDLVAALVPADDAGLASVSAEGGVPFTPIQCWFLETYTAPFDHFNQATLLESAGRLDGRAVRQTLECLIRRHAMLRCRLIAGDTGGEAVPAVLRYRQFIPPPSEGVTYAWREADISDFERTVAELHRGLSLADGRLVAAGLFHGPTTDRLLLVIHHWAVDGLSWRIVCEEFEAIYRAFVKGDAMPALRPSAPFRAWAESLRAFSSSEAAGQQLEYWRGVTQQPATHASPSSEPLDESHEFTLPADLTARLLGAANAAYGTQPNELLLAALGRAWDVVAHEPSLLLAMEGHGREGCVGNVDVSQSVGWFTSLWPFRLATAGGWPERIRQAKDALRAVPDHGVAYGVLRYLANASGLDGAAPRVSFNYLGEFGGRGDCGLLKAVPGVSTGAPAAPHLHSPFDLDVVGEVTGGCLRVAFHHHRARLAGPSRRLLVVAFEKAVRECIQHGVEDAPRQSLADVTGGVETLAELDRIAAAFASAQAARAATGSGLEDVLPLTPLQEGMVFHALREPASAAYSDQVAIRLHGPLDAAVFEKAWQALGSQHPNLRAVFRTDLTSRPVGIVLRGSCLGFRRVDVPTPPDDGSLERLRSEERADGFDVTTGPLLRVTLVRFSPVEHEAILGFHHSILDGWSSGLIWRGLEANYRALMEGAPLPRATSGFADYLRWLATRDRNRELGEWRTAMSGCPAGTVVPTGVPRLGAPPVRTRSTRWEIGRERSERLSAFARQLGTTENALFQALWGVFLGKLTDRSDVVFGATISGRSERIPNVESIVGLLINTIPVRVRWTPTMCFRELAERVRAESAAGLERVAVSLADIEGAVLASGTLIQHALVFENYPEDDPREGARRLWRTETVAVNDPMHFEFGALIVPEGGNWLCRIVADEIRYPDEYLDALRVSWEETIDRCLADPEDAIAVWTPARPVAVSRRIVVAATFTAEPLGEPLAFWCDALGCAPDIRFAPYNQVVQQLLDPAGELRTNRGGANVILVRLEDWLAADRSDAAAARSSLALAGRQFVDALAPVLESGSAQWFVLFCPASDAGVSSPLLSTELAAAEARLCTDLERLGSSRLHVWRTELLPRATCAEIGGVPYAELFFAEVATLVMRRWDACLRPPLKVLALDVDNTLWRGVLGEDGVAGIVLTPAHRRLQVAAKAAAAKGVLLALVSKNNPDALREVFERRTDFPLRWADFVAVEAGWGAKSASLAHVAASLNLGRDSIVFVDDSAMECAEVRDALPEILTLQVPDSEEAIDRFLERCWALDFVGGTAEDRNRTELYRTEAKRDQVRRSSLGGLKDFIRQLCVEVALVPIDATNLARAAQLTQRTNQFNASTLRRNESEVTTFLRQPGARGMLIDVRDRFGAYGLSGCVLYREVGAEWELETFLLSCRVLGRGVEHEVMRRLGALALERGASSLRVRFARTPKNAPVEQFLRSCATRAEADAFVFEVASMVAITIQDAGGGVRSGQESDDLRSAGGRSAGPTMEQNSDGGQAGRRRLSAPRPWAFHQAVSMDLGSPDSLLSAIADWRKRQRNRAGVVAYDAPRNDRERTIAAIWAEVLGVERVGRRDDFFGLGGHSLRAVMMISRVNRALAVELDLESVFAAPVLAQFSEKAAHARSANVASVGIAPAAPASDYPLSHAQRRLWMIEQMRGPGPSPFHMVATFRGHGPVPLDRLTLAFRRLIARHEALRTGIVIAGSVPRQVVAGEVPFEVERLPLTRETEGADTITLFLERAFDLGRPPLLRVGIHEEQDGRWTLVIVMHHLVSDGWSVGIMARELSAFFRDPTAVFEPLPVQYKDYAAWQARQLANGSWEPLGAFWRALLADMPPPLQLTSDRVRPAVKQSRGADVTASLGAVAWNAIAQQARREGASPFMALMAALQLLLARHARSRRFVVGTPVAGRELPELEPQVGFYVNLLPIVAEVPAGGAFCDHLARVKASVASALSHAAYPFDKLVDDLGLDRDMSRAPLFDVLMVYQGRQVPDVELEGVSVTAEERRSTTAQYDLTFEFAETEDGLHLRIEYDCALFDETRVRRLAEQFFAGLQNVFASPTEPLDRVEFCPAAELEQIRGFERGERFACYRAATIPQLVAQAAPRAGTGPAIRIRDREVSYPELDALSAQYAAGIKTAGAAHQALVAVAGERSEHFIAGMLGVMRAGCVFLPLDLKHPDERLRSVLSDGGVTQAIAIGASAEARLRGLGLSILGVTAVAGGNLAEQGSASEPMDSAVHSGAADRVAEPVSDSDLAYVIYTSGSTGKPKGVEVTHGAFATMIESQIAAFGIEPADRCAWWASCAFDASLSEIFLALASGATVVIAGDSEREDTERYRSWIREQRVTVATLPPAFLRVFNGASLEPLRVLITAGEAANPRDAAEYARSLRYFNAYGPTETSVCATVHRVLPGSLGDRSSSVPIGRPLPVASVYVLDEAGRRQPIGVPGGVFIGGRIVGRGYRNAPELTEERFVADPFAGDPGARMYRTGDLACWREDGTLEFLGREDGQVKVRGFRIELGEVEAAIRAVDGVRDVAVLAVRRPKGALLVAYCAGPGSIEKVVRDAVASRLPEYMRPAAYVWVERLPMNSSGKLDQAALPEPVLQGHSVTPLVGAREEALAAAWRECLGAADVGRESDFFALGGDSIKALSLTSALRSRGWVLGLKAVYAHPQLAGQALQLTAATLQASRAVCGEVPLLPIQQWFLDAHRDSPLHHFNQAVYYRAASSIDEARLRSAVDAVWRRHASLRATFSRREGVWRQYVGPATMASPDLLRLDVSGEPVEAARAVEDKWVRSLQSGLDLERGPLVRFGMVRSSAGDKVLCLTHHLVSDWVSHRVLLADINAAYVGHPLPEGGADVGDWVEAAKRWAGDVEARREALDRWRDLGSSYPNGTVAPAGRYGEVATASLTWSVEETERLRRSVSAVPRATVRDALLAAIAHGGNPLATEERTFVVQLEGHGRESLGATVDVSRTVGWFTSLFPFAVTCQADEPWMTAMARVRDEIAALPHLGASHGVLRGYAPELGVADSPAVLGFNYLGEFAAAGADAFFRLEDELPPHAISPGFERDHPVDLSAWVFGNRLHLHVAFLEPQASPTRIASWLASLSGP